MSRCTESTGIRVLADFFRYPAWLCVSCLVWCAGCTTVAPIQVAYSPNHADITQARTVMEVHEAEACSSTFLFIFSSGNTSLDEAMSQLPASAPMERLAWVTVDQKTTQYFISWEDCTVVTAHYVVGGAQPVSSGELFGESTESGDGEAAAEAKPGRADAERSSAEPERPDRSRNRGADDKIWLGSIADLYESRGELWEWRRAAVTIQMKSGERLSGTLISVSETHLALKPEYGERRRIDMLEAEWIRRE